MIDDHAWSNGGPAGRTVVVGSGELAGVWLDSLRCPGEKVIELLAQDGRVTTVVQRADGQLEVSTDGLRAAAHAVRVDEDGSAAAVRRRTR